MITLTNYLNKSLETLTSDEKRVLWESSVQDQAENMRSEISVAIKEARLHEGLTQTQLSEHTGIPQSELSRLEQGKANPTLETLAKLYVTLGISHRTYFKDSQLN